jgi:hypothetical protein
MEPLLYIGAALIGVAIFIAIIVSINKNNPLA